MAVDEIATSSVPVTMPDQAVEQLAVAEQLHEAGRAQEASEVRQQANQLTSQSNLSNSFCGKFSRKFLSMSSNSARRMSHMSTAAKRTSELLSDSRFTRSGRRSAVCAIQT